MRFKWMPVHQFEDVTGDFEQAQIHGIFDDTALGGVLSGKLPNPLLATGIVLQLAVTGTTRKIAFGSGTLTWAASVSAGAATITHGLGATPQRVLVSIEGGFGSAVVLAAYASGYGATTFSVSGSAASAVSLTATFDWLAIG